ncbi:Retrovirus-related Pol polyprotein from transposon RE1 [Linum grandiflorum]
MLKERTKARVIQFLMKLRPEFESARSSRISNNTTDFDTVLGDLTRVETRLQTQAQIDGLTTGSTSSFSAQSTQLGKNLPVSDVAVSKCRDRKRNDTRVGSGSSNNAGTGGSYNSNWNTSYSTQLVDAPTGGNSDINSLVKAALSQVLPEALQSAFASFGMTGKPTPWLLDSDAFNHMTNDRASFKTYKLLPGMDVQVANGQKLHVAGIGSVSTPDIKLPNTLHVPDLVPNLVSVGQLTEHGCSVSFSPAGCSVQDLTSKVHIGT